MPGLSPVWVGCQKMWQRLHLKRAKCQNSTGHEHVMHFLAKFGVCRVSKQFVCSLRHEASFSNPRTSIQYKSDRADYPCQFFATSSWGNQVKWLIERKLNVQKDRDHRTHHRAQLDQPEISDLAPGWEAWRKCLFDLAERRSPLIDTGGWKVVPCKSTI